MAALTLRAARERLTARVPRPMGRRVMSVTLSPMLSAAPTVSVERPEDTPLVDALIERVFGPGRLVKISERLREGNQPLRDLSFVAWSAGAAVGCVRLWPIKIGGASAILLGPFVVDDAWRGEGLGARLIESACDAATRDGHGVILLVGDEPYFRKFGFETVPQGRVTMPGPVDGRRLLWRPLRPGALDQVEGAARVN